MNFFEEFIAYLFCSCTKEINSRLDMPFTIETELKEVKIAGEITNPSAHYEEVPVDNEEAQANNEKIIEDDSTYYIYGEDEADFEIV